MGLSYIATNPVGQRWVKVSESTDNKKNVDHSYEEEVAELTNAAGFDASGNYHKGGVGDWYYKASI